MDTQYDDDSFYTEIRKEILLLTSEDNEEILERKSTGVFIPQPITYRRHHRSYSSNLGSWKNENFRLPPYWFEKLWNNENEKGTGVFIPQAVTCRRKLRPGTKNIRSQIYRAVVEN
ncbi:unnamed protein product [Lupinus luteus]|uniref:Uncharacterized protein n=1 Tax=Lupinus luteus TaxID=3873 RepID=A0AAV1X1E3_LUPLU